MARFGQHVDTVLSSVARTDYPWDIPGGWEGWFQVEFATYLTMNNIDHERENGIQGYGTPDFLFSNGPYLAHTLTGTVGGTNPPHMEIYYCGQ